MRWPARNSDGWQRRYAVMPVKIGNEIVWLEWIERRFMCEYYEVRLPTNRADRAGKDGR